MNFKQLNVMQVDGDLYKRSYELGKIYSKEIVASCIETAELLKRKTINDTLEIVKGKLARIYPQYLQEVYGKADGAKVNRDAYLLFICYEIYKERESCTDIMVKLKDGTIIGGHNEDGEYSLQDTGLIKYITDYGFLCEYFCIDTLPGSTFCWNSHGLIFTCNYVYVLHKNSFGIPTWFILRDLIDCKTIDEVLEKLDVSDAASGCNVNIVDINNNRGVSIEWRLNNLSVKELQDTLIHSNHFTRKEVGLPLALKDSNSKFRFDKIEELLRQHIIEDENDILELLQYYTNDSNFSILDAVAGDGHITAATFLYNTKTKKFLVYSYLDNKVYNVDYDMKNLLQNKVQI